MEGNFLQIFLALICLSDNSSATPVARGNFQNKNKNKKMTQINCIASLVQTLPEKVLVSRVGCDWEVIHITPVHILWPELRSGGCWKRGASQGGRMPTVLQLGRGVMLLVACCLSLPHHWTPWHSGEVACVGRPPPFSILLAIPSSAMPSLARLSGSRLLPLCTPTAPSAERRSTAP